MAMETELGAHLSIGEVLSLLKEEFPDVTISKIRFLESQGLIDPERTPSGYRKFYEPDIDRLRWVLRLQRDHFLPLKVIKARLDAGQLDVDEPEVAQPELFGDEPRDPPSVEPETVTDRDEPTEPPGPAADDDEPTEAPDAGNRRVIPPHGWPRCRSRRVPIVPFVPTVLTVLIARSVPLRRRDRSSRCWTRTTA